MKKQTYTVTITDAWRDPEGGWSANGSWTKEYNVKATTMTGAVRIAKRLAGRSGERWTMLYDTGNSRQYKVQNAAIVAFVEV